MLLGTERFGPLSPICNFKKSSRWIFPIFQFMYPRECISSRQTCSSANMTSLPPRQYIVIKPPHYTSISQFIENSLLWPLMRARLSIVHIFNLVHTLPHGHPHRKMCVRVKYKPMHSNFPHIEREAHKPFPFLYDKDVLLYGLLLQPHC